MKLLSVLLLSSAISSSANAPLPSYDWQKKYHYRIDVDTISTISLLRCEPKVTLVDGKQQTSPDHWICQTEVVAAGITYRDDKTKANVKRERIIDAQPIENKKDGGGSNL